VTRMGEERKVYRVLVGKLEGKRPLGRPRRRWKWDQNGCCGDWLGGRGVDSNGSAYRQMAGCCECGDEPSGSDARELLGT
jgi:hypothetical protein